MFVNGGAQDVAISEPAACMPVVTLDGTLIRANLPPHTFDTYSPVPVQLTEPGESRSEGTLTMADLSFRLKQPGTYTVQLMCNDRVGGVLDKTHFAYTGGIGASVPSNRITFTVD